MDELTLKYYDDNAESLFALYTSLPPDIAGYLKLAFPPGREILDIGSGAGRDLNFLIKEQYAAYGTEPSSKLREISISKFPLLQERIYSAALPDLAATIGRKFDGILCSAVLQHIPQEQQFDAAFDIRNLLKTNGRFLLSFPKERSGIDENFRDENGRLYTKLVPEAVELLFERLGFQCIGRWEDSDGLGRPGNSWLTLLFELRSDNVSTH